MSTAFDLAPYNDVRANADRVSGSRRRHALGDLNVERKHGYLACHGKTFRRRIRGRAYAH